MLIPTIDQCISTLYQLHDIVCRIDCNYSSIETARADLYSKLKLIFKQEYSNNERLIFVLEQDIYNTDSAAGGVLQAIQVILQDIDISNYFVCIVTTNPDIELEYQYIKKIISTDPVSFYLHQCAGPFKKSAIEHTAIQGKIQSLNNVDLESLTEKQRHLLFVDPIFCIMPWTGINVDTNGKVYPCCEFDREQPLGTTKTQSIDAIWHSTNTNSIRQSMLSGIPVKSCQSCYTKEKLKQPSLRNNFNKDLAVHVDSIESTKADGSIANTNISFWDIRYNNLCNFACRSCNPTASSSWYQIHNTLNSDKKLTVPLLTIETDQVVDQICKNIDHVDTIYFAGGEPSIIENFYKILELLIKHNRTDVRLQYNINMSRLSLKEKSLLNLWSHFKQVSVGASLDAEYDRASYLRVGTEWETILKHRMEIAEKCPHVDFYVSATVGIINALHVADFHKSWVTQGFINAADFNVQILLSPLYQSVAYAPGQLKHLIVKKYTQHLEWLKPLDRTGRAVHGFNSIIEMCQGTESYDPVKFWTEVNKLDQYHGTDLLHTFPELQNVGL